MLLASSGVWSTRRVPNRPTHCSILASSTCVVAARIEIARCPRELIPDHLLDRLAEAVADSGAKPKARVDGVHG